MRSRKDCLVQATVIFSLALLFGAGFLGCNGETVVPRVCHQVEGEVWVVMAEGVRADSAERALASLEVEFDSETLQDCFTLYFNVVSGDPRDHLRDLQAATQAWGVGVSLNGKVFAGLCASDPSVSISQGTGLPGLEYDHMRWYTLESILHVPAGEEDEWVVRLLQEGFISAAGQVTWCTD